MTADPVARYRWWRRAHLSASLTVAAIAMVHCAMTWFIYGSWSANAAWFLGAGLGLLLSATLNLAHIGAEPCHLRTTRFVRAANWAYFAFGLAVLAAVPQPQAFVIVTGLGIQAVVSRVTLPGPG